MTTKQIRYRITSLLEVLDNLQSEVTDNPKVYDSFTQAINSLCDAEILLLVKEIMG